MPFIAFRAPPLRCVVTLMLILSLNCTNAESVDSDPADGVQTIEYKQEYFEFGEILPRVVLVSILGVALAVGAILILARYFGTGRAALLTKSSASRIKVIEARRIAPGQTVVLVGVDEYEYLVTDSKPGGISVVRHHKSNG